MRTFFSFAQVALAICLASLFFLMTCAALDLSIQTLNVGMSAMLGSAIIVFSIGWALHAAGKIELW